MTRKEVLQCLVATAVVVALIAVYTWFAPGWWAVS